jgi:son of sevenless-like protein
VLFLQQHVHSGLGMYLTDLTFIEDGNPDMVDAGLINFDKRRKQAQVIKDIQQYQQTPYCLLEVPTIKSYLLKTSGMDEELAYAVSLSIEPRDDTSNAPTPLASLR